MNKHKEGKTSSSNKLDVFDEERSNEKEKTSDDNGVVLHQSFSGPLPPPTALIQYNQAHPDAANRIITMAEQQQAHRHRLEAQVVAGGNFRASLGLLLGAFITFSALALSGFLILNDKTVEGLTTVVVSLGTLVSLFIYSNEKKARELKEKHQDRQ